MRRVQLISHILAELTSGEADAAKLLGHLLAVLIQVGVRTDSNFPTVVMVLDQARRVLERQHNAKDAQRLVYEALEGAILDRHMGGN